MNGHQFICSQAQHGTKQDYEDPDDTLVKQAQAGDRDAFELLVLQHKESVLRTIVRITRNREDAEDEVQETFLCVFRALRHFRGDAKFTSWLTRIAVNRALICLRRRRSSDDISLDHPFSQDEAAVTYDFREWRPNPEQCCAHTEANIKLRNQVALLPHGLRSALILKHFYGYTAEDIAKKLGITTSAVKSRVHRARHRLRSQLDDRPTTYMGEPSDLALRYFAEA